MKIPHRLVVLLATCLLVVEIAGEQKGKTNRDKKINTRIPRQLNNKSNNADQMVQNILRWLQDVYGQQSRTSRSFMFAGELEPPYSFASARMDRRAFRQGSLREYLPPTNSQKPRPFEPRPPDGAGIDEDGNFVDTGYPPAGSITPQPPFTIYTNPATGGITGIGSPGEDFVTGPRNTNYPTQAPTRPPFQPGFPFASTYIPPSTYFTERPGIPTQTPGFTERPVYPDETQTPGVPEQTPGVPQPTPEVPVVTPGYPSGYPSEETQGFTGYPSGRPQEPGFETGTTRYPSGETGYPTSSPSGFTGYTSGPPSGLPGFPTVRPTPGETVGPGDALTPGGYPTASPVDIAGVTGYPTGRPGGTPSFPTGPPTGYPTGAPTDKPNGLPTGYSTGAPAGFSTGGSTGYSTEAPTGYQTGAPTGYPNGAPTGYPSEVSTGYPSGAPTGYPSGIPTGYPTGAPTGTPSFPTISSPGVNGYPTSSTGYPTGTSSGFPTVPSSEATPAIGATEEIPGPTEIQPEQPGSPTAPPTGISEVKTTAGPSGELPDFPTASPTGETPDQTSSPNEDTGVKVIPDDDLKHPPHIHALDVQCAKDMMTINIEFNREFNGVIYSKGYYNMPECRYVNENSGQTKYIFTVNLNMCGTEFVNAFDTEGQSYLENILVLQNELGIQEVWDTVRSVRCLWEGNLKEQLSVTLMVGMLSQEIVTFSGDTAMAKLDVLLGRGPFGQPASGLVKIGEQMTLVVSVSGDPGFDVQVKDCRATDSSGSNIVPLTDDNGCILKPKLFGSFQKTRNTGDSGASIIAYAYFNAFKFPDVMDIMIECNIELCKTDCEMCPDPNLQLEPAKRRKRDVSIGNETLHDSVLMAKHLRIVLPEDLALAVDIAQHDGICMSTQSFVYSSSTLISLLTASCLLSAYLWFTTQKLRLMKR